VDADHLKERELATEKKNGAALATEAPSSEDVQLAVYVLKTTCSTHRGTRRNVETTRIERATSIKVLYNTFRKYV